MKQRRKTHPAGDGGASRAKNRDEGRPIRPVLSGRSAARQAREAVLGHLLAGERVLDPLLAELRASLARPGVPPHLVAIGRYVADVLGGVRANLDEASSQLIGELDEALIERQARRARRPLRRGPAPSPTPSEPLVR